ncbi:MAG: LPXTG cell wall anchor domain-containing protein [Parolsenella sp.]|nr:LPXTG cell wall anchor domain-containing protein [Parolsenella sp.]
MKTKRCIGQRGNLGHFERVGLGFGAVCAVLVAALVTPTPAMAADWIEINGERYEAGTSQGDPTGGSWEWNGDSTLTLKDYDGGAIGAGGNLDIVCEGENSVKNADGEGSVLWQEGDGTLTVKGSGSLSVAATGGFYDIKAISAEGNIALSDGVTVSVTSVDLGNAIGIMTNGSVSIDKGATFTANDCYAGIIAIGGVTIDVASANFTGSFPEDEVPHQEYGVMCGGPLAIKNSSAVRVKLDGYAAIGLSVTKTASWDGPSVAIADSVVDIAVNSTAETVAPSGIVAMSTVPDNEISIARSTVTVDSPSGPAIMAQYQLTDAETADRATITIDGCKIVEPTDGRVCDISLDFTNYDYGMPVVRGQFIGVGDVRGEFEAPDYSNDAFACVSRKVVIRPDAPVAPEPPATTGSATTEPPATTEPATSGSPVTPVVPTTPATPAVTQGAATTTEEKALPQTGDSNSSIAVAAFIIGGILALALAFVASRSNE